MALGGFFFTAIHLDFTDTDKQIRRHKQAGPATTEYLVIIRGQKDKTQKQSTRPEIEPI